MFGIKFTDYFTQFTIPEIHLETWLQYSAALATLVSVFAVVVVAALGFWINQNRLRRDFTQNIMLQRLSNPDLVRASQLIANRVAISDSYPINPPDDEENRLVVMLLSYYEFVAVGYLRKDLSRKIVKRQAQNAMKSAYFITRDYILNRRSALDRKRLYIELETLAKRF